MIFHIGEHTQERILQQLLQVHAETLESLVVMKSKSDLCYPNFPFGIHLPKLATLIVPRGIVANLNFLKHTSALKSLNILPIAGINLELITLSFPFVRF